MVTKRTLAAERKAESLRTKDRTVPRAGQRRIEPGDLSAAEAARHIADGTLRSETLVAALLERIARREPEIGAFAFLDPDIPLDEARIRDREPSRGPLHGVPVAIKDVFDTFDMPTAYGSPIYRGHRPPQDSAVVAAIRAGGGVILGKTVTPEFATQHPPKTRNPHDLTRSPGGSSSGSAAAVAAGMVPLAIGSQTTGSVVRPASYCGIVGYKPSFHALNVAGMKPLAPSMDTTGILCRSVEDAALLASTLWDAPMPDFARARLSPPRVAFCRTPQWIKAEPWAQRATEAAVKLLARGGARVSEVALPASFDEVEAAVDTIVGFEMWRTLAFERRVYPALLSPRLGELLALGQAKTGEAYRAAQALVVRCRAEFAAFMRDHDVVVAPPATGEAPLREAGTGDPTFCKIWTIIYGPAISVPATVGPAGLPFGLQVAAPYGSDAQALAAADWIAQTLA